MEGMARVYFTRLLSGTQLLLSGFGVVAVLMNGGRLIHMTMAVFITALLNYAAVRWGVHKVAGGHLVPPVRLNRNNLAKFTRIATPLGIMSLSAFMGSSVQVPLVGFILGTTAVPAYFLAQRIGTVLNQACLQFVFPQTPLFTQEVGARNYSNAIHRMKRTLFLTSALIVMANILFYAASPTLADHWIGPGRYLTGLPLLILAIDFCLMYGAVAWGSFILARGINPFMRSTLLSGVITVTLCLVLGQRFGVLGIATASLVAGLCTNYWFIPFQGLKMLRSFPHGSPTLE
jgi:O-antigen/teichoic acid export membrane protein